MRSRAISVLVLITLAVVLVAFLIYIIETQAKLSPGDRIIKLPGLPTSTETPFPTGLIKAPTPYLQIPEGRQSFTVRTGNTGGPMGTQIVVDPFNAQKGTQQTVTLGVEYKGGKVDSVDATLITDNAKTKLPMHLVSGDNSSGTWSITWSIEDTHEVTYQMDFSINYSGGKQYTINFPIR